MLVGISIKIALHHPEADGFFSEEQRQFTGSVLAASCAMQLILYPLNVGFKTYCARRGPTPQYATRTDLTACSVRATQISHSAAVSKRA